jgi:hypothetical protein
MGLFTLAVLLRRSIALPALVALRGQYRVGSEMITPDYNVLSAKL